MQIHESGKATPYIKEILYGKKTVEGRLARGKFLTFQVGDDIHIREDLYENGVEVGTIPDRARVRITKVENYPSFEIMLARVGYKRAVPHARSLAAALGEYRKYYPAADEQRYGVLAIHFVLLPQ